MVEQIVGVLQYIYIYLSHNRSTSFDAVKLEMSFEKMPIILLFRLLFDTKTLAQVIIRSI